MGLDAHTMNIIVNVQNQSSEIANAVHTNKEDCDIGAGD